VGIVTRAIDSVLAQTYKNYEIIVVDDGSTDDTGKVLQEKYSDRINYIYQSNAGAAAARNTGIRASRYDLIAFLDSDDIWLPRKLELQVPLMSGAGVVLSYSNLINEENGLRRDYFSEIGISFDSEPVVLDYPLRTLLRKGGCGIWTPVVICRKKALQRVGCFDERMRIYEDVRLWTGLSQEGKWAVTSEPLAIRIWSKSGEQLMKEDSSFYRESSKMRLEIFLEAYARNIDGPSDVQQRLRSFIARDLVQQATYFALDKKYNAARRKAFESLVYSPRGTIALKAFLSLLSPRLFSILIRRRWAHPGGADGLRCRMYV
jgi:glycosyltransferase involved in cell wall biosynthesis